MNIPNKLKGGIKETLKTKRNAVEVRGINKNEYLVYVAPTSQDNDSMVSQSTFRLAGAAGGPISRAHTAQQSKERLDGTQSKIKQNTYTTMQHPIRGAVIKSSDLGRPNER